MTNHPPFKRYASLQGVEYEMLSSNGRTYYTVPMLNGKAIGCQCRFSQFNPTCKHQQEAEKEEQHFINSQPTAPAQTKDEEKRRLAPLNGSRGFSLMR